MRLRPGQESTHPPRLKTMEAVKSTPEQQKVRFDITTDVPAEMWEEKREYFQGFIGDSFPRLTGDPLISLEVQALLDSRIRALARSNHQLVRVLRGIAEEIWPIALGSNEYRRNEIADAKSIVPDLSRDLKRPTDGQFQNILETSAWNQGKYPIFKLESLRNLVSVMQLFPERQAEARAFLDRPKFKAAVDMALEQQLTRAVSGPIEVLAYALLLYPAEADRFKELAEPYWAANKKTLKDNSKFEPFHLLRALAVLGADEARINDQGELVIQFNQRAVAQATPLPPRLVA